MKSPREKFTRIHPLAWLWEPLEADATFVLRTMFGAKALYLDGMLMLCCCAGDEPWRGLLVCTSRDHHASLQGEFPGLAPHPVLPKWLYLPESSRSFEKSAPVLVGLVRRRDPRFGVQPQARKRSGAQEERKAGRPGKSA